MQTASDLAKHFNFNEAIARIKACVAIKAEKDVENKKKKLAQM